MKKQLKVLAAAAGLSLAATNAHASLTQGSIGPDGSSLFLAVWNSTTSYVRDLGITMNTVLNGTPGNINSATAPNPTWVSNAGFTATFAGDSLFSSTFAGGLAGVQWTIFAYDSAASTTNPAAPAGFVSGFSIGPTTLTF